MGGVQCIDPFSIWKMIDADVIETSQWLALCCLLELGLVNFDTQDQARTHQTAVDGDAARAAIAGGATFLAASEA